MSDKIERYTKNEGDTSDLYTPEQLQAIFLRIPGAVLQELMAYPFFEPLMKVITPLYLEYDILGSRYVAMTELLLGLPSTYQGYPLYEEIEQKLADSRARGELPSASEFRELFDSILDAVRAEIYPEDPRPRDLILEVVLNRYLNESPNVPKRSPKNREWEKLATIQTFYARFERDKPKLLAELREMSQRASRNKAERSAELATTAIPLIMEYSAAGDTFEEIAIKLNYQGFKTANNHDFTGEAVGDLLAVHGINNMAKIRNQKLLASVQPIITRMTAQNATFAQIAEELNTAGHKTSRGDTFTEGTVRGLMLRNDLPTARDLYFEKQHELKNEAHELFDGFPYQDVTQANAAIARLQQLAQEMGGNQFREEFSDHWHYSYIFTEARWRAPLLSFVVPYITEQLREWGTSPDQDLSIMTLEEAVIALIQHHPLNGAITKEAMYEEISETLSTIFSLFNHPYQELIKPTQLKTYLGKVGKHSLILPAQFQPSQVFKPKGSEVEIPLSEIQQLFDEDKNKEEVAAALSEKYKLDVTVSSLKSLIQRKIIANTPQLRIEEQMDKEESEAITQIQEVEKAQRELQSFLLEHTFEELNDAQRKQWELIMSFSRGIRDNSKLYQRLIAHYGGSVSTLRGALEEGILPQRSLALVVAERLVLDLYFHFSEKVWKVVEAAYGFSPEYVHIENSTDRVGIMMVEEFVTKMGNALLKENRESLHLYENQGEFYQELSNRMVDVFTVAAHPFAIAVNRGGLIQSMRDSNINKEILTTSTFWKTPLAVVEGIEASLEDIMVKVMAEAAAERAWPSSDQDKISLMTEAVYFELTNSDQLLIEGLDADVILKYFEKYPKKLLAKMNMVRQKLNADPQD